MTCCENILVLSCAYSCDIIQIGINAPATGNYTIELQPDGVKVVTTANTIATPLVFAAGYLNEDATHVFKIIKPDGTYLESGIYDCFQLEIKPTVNATLANVDITPVACAVATAVLKNSVGTVIDTEEINSGASEDIIAPDATAVLKNTDGDVIDTEAIPSNVSEDITIANVSWTDSDGSAESTPYGDAIVCTAQVKAATVYFAFDAGDDTSALFTNPDTTLTLTALAQDGASGTITVSVNGGAYAAFSNPTVVTNGQTLQVKRTSTVAAGSVTITGTYA